MKRLLLLLLFTSILSGSALAQSNFDSIVNTFEKEFENFKESIIQEHQEFISRNDSIFLSFLGQPWEEKETFKNEHIEKPKPIKQPVQETRDTLTLRLDYVPPKPAPVVPAILMDSAVDLVPIPDKSYMIACNFDFFGNNEKIYYSPQIKPSLEMVEINYDNIEGFYRSLTRKSTLWDYCTVFLEEARQKYSLNDWGYYQLAKSLSESIFDSENGQTLFCGYLLLRSGYYIKYAYKENKIYLLITSAHKLYSITYLTGRTQKLYILGTTGEKMGGFNVHPGEYPGNNRPFSFDLKEYPKFEGNLVSREINFRGHTIALSFQDQDIDFLNTYLHCELGAFFHGGISENNLKALDELFIPMLEGKNDEEKVNLLLDFCQNALKYKTDGEQFGKERYLFAEETLYYPYSDCEDRSILLASLVKRYTGLQSVALDFPGHVAMAVHIPGKTDGIYYEYNGVRYTACDPTYTNSTIGMLNTNYHKQTPEFVTY